jgi:hypothetical protein
MPSHAEAVGINTSMHTYNFCQTYAASQCCGSFDAQLAHPAFVSLCARALQPSTGRKLLVTGSGVQDLDFLKSESEKRLQVICIAKLTRHLPEFAPWYIHRHT